MSLIWFISGLIIFFKKAVPPGLLGGSVRHTVDEDTSKSIGFLLMLPFIFDIGSGICLTMFFPAPLVYIILLAAYVCAIVAIVVYYRYRTPIPVDAQGMLAGTDIPADQADLAQRIANKAYRSTLLFILMFLTSVLGLVFAAWALVWTTQAIRLSVEHQIAAAQRSWAQVMRILTIVGMLVSTICILGVVALALSLPPDIPATFPDAAPTDEYQLPTLGDNSEVSPTSVPLSVQWTQDAATSTAIQRDLLSGTLTQQARSTSGPGYAPSPTPTATPRPTVTPAPTESLVVHFPPMSPPAEYCKTGGLHAQITSDTYLCMVSQPRDSVGQGMNWILTSDDQEFHVNQNDYTCNSRRTAIDIRPRDITFNITRWGVEFRAPEGTQLVAGVYENAMRSSFMDPGFSGLTVIGAGGGCNQLSGRFEILQTGCEPNATSQVFVATFEQHCGMRPAALLGYIRVPVSKYLNP